MTFDPRNFLSHLDDFDVPEAQKIAVIEAMWLLARGYVDHAHGLSSGQQLWTENSRENSSNSGNVVPFQKAADGAAPPANDNQIQPPKKGTTRL